MCAIVRIVLCITAFGLFAGCAAYPVVQVAGGAMTGYDAVMLADEHLPRNAVQGGSLTADMDRMLERRLRERLRMQSLHRVQAHVVDARAYLVGHLDNRHQANQALDIAKNVQGLTAVTVKFHPTPDHDRQQADAALLAQLNADLREAGCLDDSQLRTAVLDGAAVLMGRACNYRQKTAAVAVAHEIGGITNVVDYITVPAAIEDRDDLALN